MQDTFDSSAGQRPVPTAHAGAQTGRQTVPGH